MPTLGDPSPSEYGASPTTYRPSGLKAPSWWSQVSHTSSCSADSGSRTPEQEPSPVNSVCPATRPVTDDVLTTRLKPPNSVMVPSGATTL